MMLVVVCGGVFGGPADQLLKWHCLSYTRYLVWKSPWYPSVRKYKHTFVINVYIQTLLTFTDRSKEVQQSCVVGRTKDREHEMSIENIHDTYQRTTYNIRLRYL